MALTRGRLVAREGELDGRAVEFMFNPTEYSVRKSNSWNFQSKKAGNVPTWEFGGGGPRELQLQLLFDATLPGRGDGNAVRRATDLLFSFMMIDKTIADRSPVTTLGRPPRCVLEWGRDSKSHFPCYVSDCSVKYLMFSEDGVPLRATADLTLKEVSDPADLARQNPTSGGEPGMKVYKVREGDRIDWIAFLSYGDASLWQRIAKANDLPDPATLRPGTTLTIPPL